MMQMMPGMWGMLSLAFLFSALVIVATVAGVWWLVRRSRSNASDGALAILRDRYARGEISREEFEARRKDLAA